MNRYAATFHTHLSALLSFRALSGRGIACRLAPVPRVLSSSCGTCLFYEAEAPLTEALDGDREGVYELSPEGAYRLLSENR